MKSRTRLALLMAGVLTAGLANAQLEPEQLSVEELPDASPHWVFVGDVSFFHMPDSKVVLLNGDAETTNEAYLGMMSTGYNPAIEVAPDGSELYSAETYYSRGTRGDREDIVTIFDTHTLKPVGEIDIPEKRHFSLLQPYGLVTANGGSDLLVFNVTPATSVSVVSLEDRKYLNEIPLPGCAFMYPAPEGRRFGSLCADGSFVVVDYDGDGKETDRNRMQLFDAGTSHLFEKPVYVDDTLYFVSHEGTVHPVNWSGKMPEFGDTWQLASDSERKAGWLPGGWQMEAGHSGSDSLYVLMHKGGENTHKDPGTEVWVYDTGSGDRSQRIELKNAAVSIQTTADDEPLLFALRADFSGMDVYDAQSGEYLHGYDGFADTPFLMRRP
ncbi:Aralkylamine dehydrogenase heavy chain [wastewater metagenome]|uniref:Aralkylamine dehydrogenase heavy chain n=2 Tax=unclassified sequences TaxID=12908 RepID=A0A5B8R751_9ZZZZ|nr:amine dehydrogenase large subunit [Arhodomonas sp. KWT]QEA03778.1 aralkylamine dehydrogenase heavy chain [uncultured organism]